MPLAEVDSWTLIDNSADDAVTVARGQSGSNAHIEDGDLWEFYRRLA